MNDPRTPDLTPAADVAGYMQRIGVAARQASRIVARSTTAGRNRALERMAAAIRRDESVLLDANAQDVAAARASGHDDAFVDRLTLTTASIEAMAKGLSEVVALPDPVGELSDLALRPSGVK